MFWDSKISVEIIGVVWSIMAFILWPIFYNHIRMFKYEGKRWHVFLNTLAAIIWPATLIAMDFNLLINYVYPSDSRSEEISKQQGTYDK